MFVVTSFILLVETFLEALKFFLLIIFNVDRECAALNILCH